MHSTITLRDDLANKIIVDALDRPFDHLTGYMNRFWVVSPQDELGPSMTARVHEILKSDDGEVLHDHPWDYVTVILKGGYFEITQYSNELDAKDAASAFERSELKYDTKNGKWEVAGWFGPGSVVHHAATDPHRLRLPEGETATTLFMMGGYKNRWGFYTGSGKVYWRDYLKNDYVEERVQKIDVHYTEGRPGEAEQKMTSPLLATLADVAKSGEHDVSPELMEVIRSIVMSDLHANALVSAGVSRHNRPK